MCSVYVERASPPALFPAKSDPAKELVSLLDWLLLPEDRLILKSREDYPFLAPEPIPSSQRAARLQSDAPGTAPPAAGTSLPNRWRRT